MPIDTPSWIWGYKDITIIGMPLADRGFSHLK